MILDDAIADRKPVSRTWISIRSPGARRVAILTEPDWPSMACCALIRSRTVAVPVAWRACPIHWGSICSENSAKLCDRSPAPTANITWPRSMLCSLCKGASSSRASATLPPAPSRRRLSRPTAALELPVDRRDPLHHLPPPDVVIDPALREGNQTGRQRDLLGVAASEGDAQEAPKWRSGRERVRCGWRKSRANLLKAAVIEGD